MRRTILRLLSSVRPGRAESELDREIRSHLQLLELSSGELLLRVAYASDGRARRGPVTVRSRDLERLRTELESRPRLREALLGS